MTDAIFWVHDDALGDPPNLPAIYIFDDEKLLAEQWSLKRIGFVYECLLELPVEIRRGDPVGQVVEFAASRGATRVITTETPDPRLRAQQAALAQRVALEIITPEPFVEISGRVDLKRFSRYWDKASRCL